MGGNGSDKGGFPDDIFQQMQAGHEKFMRELEEEGRRFQQEPETSNKSITKPSPPSTASSDDRNVFVSFKDFVDTNLSSLAESVRSLPSNIAELRAKMQEERQARKQEELEIWRRWTGLEDSPDHVQMMAERAAPEHRQQAVSAAMMLLREARDRNAHVPQEKIEALYKDTMPPGSLDVFAAPMLSPGGACYYQPDTGYNAPSTAIWRAGTPSYRWLSVDWFKRSQYSPITLEQHPDLSEAGSKWRAAFEDLVNATLDKPMVSREQVGVRPNGFPQSTATGPGLDWMLSLQCRGILPPQLPSLYNAQWPNSAKGVNLAVAEKQLMTTALTNRRYYAGTPTEDIHQLIHEIATPAPQQGVAQPETELDLYNAPLQKYLADLAILDQAHKWNTLAIAQLKQDESDAGVGEDSKATSEAEQAWFTEQQRLDAEDDLTDALVNGDATAIGKCLHGWLDAHGSIGELSQSLEEILGQSGMFMDTPSYPYVEEAFNKMSESEKQLLMIRAKAAREERLEQEREALGLDAADGPIPDECSVAPSKPDVEQPKVDVLSSLTTTHTTRLPDGTVTTKVVLKQRFADGREETEEKVHTYQEPSRPQIAQQHQEEMPRKKGWFWT